MYNTPSNSYDNSYIDLMYIILRIESESKHSVNAHSHHRY